MNRELYLMKSAFIAVKHDQFGRVKSGKLATELTTDTAARTCHQYATIDDVVRNLLEIGVDFAATQQVFVGKVANIAWVEWTFIQVLHWWHNLHIHAQFLGTSADVADERRVSGWTSNEQCCCTSFSACFCQALSTADDWHTRDT